MHILYIDDDLEDREIFREAISEIGPGYVCNVATDGSQGLQILQDFVVMPDFIFVDVNMPVMGGRQFLEKVKSTPTLRSIPIYYHGNILQALIFSLYKFQESVYPNSMH